MRIAEAERSLDDIRRMVSTAVEKRWPGKQGEYSYAREVFADYCIVERGGKLWKVPFTIQDDAAVLGEPEEVEQEYVPAGEVLEAAGAATAAPTGRKWRVRIFEYGLSLNRYEVKGKKVPLLWTRESAEALLPHLDGAQAFANHPKRDEHRDVRDLIGWYSNAAVGERGPEADLEILESEEWAQRKMLAAWKAGHPLAFSIRTGLAGKLVTHQRQPALQVLEFSPGLSVDLVSTASSGGATLDVLEQHPGGNPAGTSQSSASTRSTLHEKGAQRMKERIRKILESLRSLPHVGETHVAEATAIEAELKKEGADEAALFERATEAYTEASAEVAERNGEGKDIDERVEELNRQVAEAERKQKVAEAKQTLHVKIAESKLPATLQKLVRDDITGMLDDESFDPAKCTAAFIDGKIKRVRESYAPLAEGNKARKSAAPATVGLEEADKARIAMHKLFGVTHEWNEVREGQLVRMVRGEPLDRSVPAFRGIQEGYIHFTGDRDITHLYDSNPKLHVSEDWLAASFSNALGDSIRRAMLADYMEPDYGLDVLVPQQNRTSLPDFRTQERIRVGYFGDLPTVDPETADYAELDRPTDEKATYAAVQFGGLVTVTRKMILGDDLGVVRQIVSRLGRSARRTLARRVFNLMVNNAAIYDGTAWFHATLHGANLRTTALSATELDVIRGVMRNQTEKDSGERLGIGPAILVVPHELEGTAKTENMREFLDDQLAPNPVRFMFGQNGERIIISPLLTDATDFFVFADQTQVPCIEVGFIQGRQEPELVIADSPTSERVFTSDRIRWKIRHEYEAVVIDFRGAARNTVAG